jgi:hypothetical protein
MMTRINTPQNPCKVKFVLANLVLHFTNSYQSMSIFIYLYCNYLPGSQVELYMGLNLMNMSGHGSASPSCIAGRALHQVNIVVSGPTFPF